MAPLNPRGTLPGGTDAQNREGQTGRSLVLVVNAAAGFEETSEPMASRPTVPQVGTSATFLTHLIATSQRLPQTRARRRADPYAASKIYGDTMRAPACTGLLLREVR